MTELGLKPCFITLSMHAVWQCHSLLTYTSHSYHGDMNWPHLVTDRTGQPHLVLLYHSLTRHIWTTTRLRQHTQQSWRFHPGSLSKWHVCQWSWQWCRWLAWGRLALVLTTPLGGQHCVTWNRGGISVRLDIYLTCLHINVLQAIPGLFSQMIIFTSHHRYLTYLPTYLFLHLMYLTCFHGWLFL